MRRSLLAAIVLTLGFISPLHAGKVKEARAASPSPAGRITPIAERLPDMWQHLKTLSSDVASGKLTSTNDVIARSKAFYTPERMRRIEAVIPGWTHMASYDRGKTLWHVNVAMVALLQLDEYAAMTADKKIVQEWIVLLHDLAKEPVSGRDHRHPFRSAAQVGRILPDLGFPVTAAYTGKFQPWFALTDKATKNDASGKFPIQDNTKLPAIMDGAKEIFAEPTRTAVVSIALHQSITSLAAWPVPAPMSRDQVKSYVDPELHPALLALTLADSGGWNLFDKKTLGSMYKETRGVFTALPR